MRGFTIRSVLALGLSFGAAPACERHVPPPTFMESGSATTRAAMLDLRADVERLFPLTPDVQSIEPLWKSAHEEHWRKIHADPGPSASPDMQEEMVLRARYSAYMLALAGLNAKLSPEQRPLLAAFVLHQYLDEVERTPSPPALLGLAVAWTTMLEMVASIYDGSGESGQAQKARWLHLKTAEVLESRLIALNAYSTLAASAELRGLRAQAIEFRRAGLQAAVALLEGDEAEVETSMLYNGSTRRAAVELTKSRSREVDGAIGKVSKPIVELLLDSSEAELAPLRKEALRRLVERKIGLAASGVFLAAYAHGEDELARAAIGRLREAFQWLNDPGTVSRETARAEAHEALLAAGETLDREEWNTLAQSADSIRRSVLQSVPDIEQGSRAAEDTMNGPIVNAYEVGLTEAELTLAYAPLAGFYGMGAQGGLIDPSVVPLLDRIGDSDLRVALSARLVQELEVKRTTLQVDERLRYFDSIMAQRVYGGLLRALLDRNQPGDAARALTIGELARARHMKDVTGVSPEAARELHAEPLSFARELQRRLGKRQLLVSYHVFEDGIGLIAADKKKVQSTFVPMSRAVLEEKVRTLRAGISRPNGRPGAELAGLGDELITPVVDRLAGKAELIVLPDGVLSTLPFGVLSTPDGRAVVQQLDVSYLPSIALFLEPSESSAARALLALADPTYPRVPDAPAPVAETPGALRSGAAIVPLPDTREEARAIAQHFDDASQVWLAEQAQESRLKQSDLSSYGYVHFATHGILDSEIPGVAEPALVLAAEPSEDGFLTVSEAQKLKLNARVAVLSACNTGSGEIYAGEGAMGMSRAFLLAGADTVVVSLWQVPSRETKELMVRFYEHLAKGDKPAAALRKAKLSLLASDVAAQGGTQRGLRLTVDKSAQAASTAHPFFWSGFIVLGDHAQQAR